MAAGTSICEHQWERSRWSVHNEGPGAAASAAPADQFPYHVVVHSDSDAYSLQSLMTWFYRHNHLSWRWFKRMGLIWLKAMIIKSHTSGQAFKMFNLKVHKLYERENIISHLEGTRLVTRTFLSWSWWRIFASKTFQILRLILALLQIWLMNLCTGPAAGSTLAVARSTRTQISLSAWPAKLVPRQWQPSWFCTTFESFIEFWV